MAIPDGTQLPYGNVFYRCNFLISVTLPAAIPYIGPSMFYNNFALQAVDIPETVDIIDVYAFFCCNALEEVVIPEGVTLLDEFIFSECTALKHFTIPASVTEIRDTALAGIGSGVTYHVTEGSYAEEWCREHDQRYEHTAAPAR